MEKQLLQKAVNMLGGQKATAVLLAERTGKPVSQGRVWNWLNRDTTIPPEVCRHIEHLTNGEVTAEQLRPDIFAPLEQDSAPGKSAG